MKNDWKTTLGNAVQYRKKKRALKMEKRNRISKITVSSFFSMYVSTILYRPVHFAGVKIKTMKILKGQWTFHSV